MVSKSDKIELTNVTTTYERWRKRNWQKMDIWIRGSDPVERERERQRELRVERYYQKEHEKLDRALKRIQKQKELIIKEQHNCRATGYWKTNSIKYNFLLIAHEYLFVFKK